MLLVLKIFFLIVSFVFVIFHVMKVMPWIFSFRNMVNNLQKTLVQTEPHDGESQPFMALILVKVLLFFFSFFGMLWVMSIEGNSFIEFWTFIIGFVLVLCPCAYVYMHNLID